MNFASKSSHKGTKTRSRMSVQLGADDCPPGRMPKPARRGGWQKYSSNTIKVLFASIVCFALTVSMPAQVSIYKGKEKPTNPQTFDWHYDGKTQTTSVFLDSAWKVVIANVNVKITPTGKRFVLVTRLDKPITYLYNRAGKLLQTDDGSLQIYDCIYVWTPFDNYAVFNDQGMCLAYVNRAQIEFPDPEKVNGQLAFCLPKSSGEMYRVDQNEWHTWGMLGTNGEWLIEPKFDEPFRFQNGFAEVMYYGERRKINEKGAFVGDN
jgi:hypothetical protein